MRGESAPLIPNRAATTATIITACVMQGLDTTIVNVCLPHIQGSMSASQDQISWVLTSYIVASAIMMPLTGWLAGHFGVKYIFLASVIGFTLASALCGAATSLTQLVLYRVLQGVCSAGLVPLGQTTLFTIYPRERHGYAMAIFSTGAMMGPIVGPTLGGWLTENLGWRWCFYINLPVGTLCALGIFAFIRQTRTMRREQFDMFGFATLSIAVGSLQLMLDRGQLKDWFHSTEIWIEATIAALCFYLFIVHTMTTGERSFLNRELLKSPNFVAGSLLMFGVGMILTGTLALMPSMMQVLMNYPVFDAGWMMASRGFGTMLAMSIVARMINRVDNRLFILVGFPADRGLAVADDRVLAVHGVRTDPGRRVRPGLRAWLHLCAAQSSRPIGPATSHPDPGNRDPRPDADARWQHRHRHPRDPAHSEYPDRSFPSDRAFAPGQPAGPGTLPDGAVQPDAPLGDRGTQP